MMDLGFGLGVRAWDFGVEHGFGVCGSYMAKISAVVGWMSGQWSSTSSFLLESHTWRFMGSYK